MDLHPEVVVADYVLQVNIIFTKSRVNVRGSFNVWRKGGKFGIADELMRWCPQTGCLGLHTFGFLLTPEEEARITKDGDKDLDSIPIRAWPEDIRTRHDTWYDGASICPKCQVMSPRSMLADSYGFNMPLGKVATRMVDIFRHLDSNADVYLVRAVEDGLFHEAKRELRDTLTPDMDKYRDLLERGRAREQVLYPLRKIVKDTRTGNIEKRFLALLKA